MNIKDVLYDTPEMSERKLIELIDSHKNFLKKDLNKKFNNSEDILHEWDSIQNKDSFLTKSQRDQILALVSYCLYEMVNGKSTSNN